ncbi:hypothetical protein [Endozoicomonas sp. 4G]|uniref:hypothetical protein n=1 Tax=Endozoicomonas sp. 4G TaxID=2872754 RepID=UPI002078F7F9|nr:hypothetical protein [Endozoicomonas sp. 4G]
MNATAKKEQNNEYDHQLNTLTDVVRIVGGTRSDVKVLDSKVDRLSQDVKVLDSKVDRLEQKVDQQGELLNQQGKRLDQQGERLDQQGADIAAIKEMVQVLLTRQ